MSHPPYFFDATQHLILPHICMTEVKMHIMWYVTCNRMWFLLNHVEYIFLHTPHVCILQLLQSPSVYSDIYLCHLSYNKKFGCMTEAKKLYHILCNWMFSFADNASWKSMLCIRKTDVHSVTFDTSLQHYETYGWHTTLISRGSEPQNTYSHKMQYEIF